MKQHLAWVCECGLSHCAEMSHYQRVRCSCGVTWWALQPKRDGAFALYHWPGNWQMKRAQERSQAWNVGRENG